MIVAVLWGDSAAMEELELLEDEEEEKLLEELEEVELLDTEETADELELLEENVLEEEVLPEALEPPQPTRVNAENRTARVCSFMVLHL